MNTLSKQYTSKFFKTQEDYVEFRYYWSKLVNSDRKDELKAVHHLVYLILCGKNWHRGFALLENTVKLENGAKSEIVNALEWFNSNYRESQVIEPFGKLITHEMLVEARRLVGEQSFVNGKYYNESYVEGWTK